MICRACGSTLRRRQNGQKCRKCHVWARTACGRDVVDLQCCRMSGVASKESQSQSCAQRLGSSAVERAPRLTQGTEQAKDVQMADVQIADVQSDLQPPSERAAHRGGAHRLSRSQCRSIWPHRVRARRSRRAVRKPRTPQQCSLGPRRSCWSWRHHCRRCEPSGTSRGA